MAFHDFSGQRRVYPEPVLGVLYVTVIIPHTLYPLYSSGTPHDVPRTAHHGMHALPPGSPILCTHALVLYLHVCLVLYLPPYSVHPVLYAMPLRGSRDTHA